QLLGVRERFELADGVIGALGSDERRPALDRSEIVAVGRPVVGRYVYRREACVGCWRRGIRGEILGYGGLLVAVGRLEGRPAALIGRDEVHVVAARGNLPHAVLLQVVVLQ